MNDSDNGIVHAHGRAETVHKYPEDSNKPKCGAYTPDGIARKRGAEKRNEVDPAAVDPWQLCQDCYPDMYKKYPDNNHWFDVKPAHKWNGKLGSGYSCFVECDHCGWKEPATSKSQAYSMGYDHKRYPDRGESDDASDSVVDVVESVSEGDEVRVNDGPWGVVSEVSDQYDSALADGKRLSVEMPDGEMMVRSFPGNGMVAFSRSDGERGDVESFDVRG